MNVWHDNSDLCEYNHFSFTTVNETGHGRKKYEDNNDLAIIVFRSYCWRNKINWNLKKKSKSSPSYSKSFDNLNFSFLECNKCVTINGEWIIEIEMTCIITYESRTVKHFAYSFIQCHCFLNANLANKLWINPFFNKKILKNLFQK